MAIVMNADHLLETRRLVDSGDSSLLPAMDVLIARAESALSGPARSVMDKTHIPPSGDKHDYVSFGTYWWPDPSTPEGLPYVRRDGETNPENRGPRTDASSMKAMAEDVHALALAHFFSRAHIYAGRAAHLLRVWFLDPASRMNPHLKFGQGIPGRCDGRGIGIIDTTALLRVADVLDLPEAGHGLPEEVRSGLIEWFASYLDWLVESDIGKEERAQENNHGTWYDVQVARFALSCGRIDLARSVLKAAARLRIAAQVAPDGSQPRELARTRSFSYSAMNLNGLCSLAILARRVGIDLWSFACEEGQGIRAAAGFMAPYADPAKKWPYPQITDEDRMALVPALRESAFAYRHAAFSASLGSLDKGDLARHAHRLFLPDGLLPA